MDKTLKTADELIITSYITIQVLSRSSDKLAIQTNELRAKYCDYIARRTAVSDEVIQTAIESLAIRVKHKKLTLKQAIKIATKGIIL